MNQASADELARLPRVGPSLAGKIVAHREKNGPFKRAEDLMEVAGIGEKMFASLKPYVAVSGPTTLTEKVSSKGTTAKAAPKAKAAGPRGEGRQVTRRAGRELDLPARARFSSLATRRQVTTCAALAAPPAESPSSSS